MTFRTAHRSRLLSVSGVMVGLGIFLSGAFGQVAFAAKSDLVRAKRAGGGESSLFEKLVVVSKKALLAKEPGGVGKFVRPYSVYFRMKTPDGTNQKDGHYRVGDSKGTFAGWIKIEHVRSWNTRFVIEPLEPRPNRVFTIQDDKGVDMAKLEVVAGGTRRFAFITGKPQKIDGKESDSGPFPVIVCTQQVKSTADGSDFTDELSGIQDLKLEVVFVTESTDFMLIDFDGTTVRESVQDLMKRIVNAAANDPILSKGEKRSVRFGWAEYQDCNQANDKGEGPSFISRMTQPLTDNYAEFLGRIDAFKPEKIEGDWPEDALSGLNTALDRAGWEKNSTKHVILIGSANMHHHRYGSGPNQFGSSNNAFTRQGDRTNTTAKNYRVTFGQNSSGISLDQLLAKASPEGGAVEVKARNSRRFHAVLSGRPIPPELKNNPDFMKAVDTLITLDDDTLTTLIQKDKEFLQNVLLAGRVKLITLCRERAKQDFLKLTYNRGNKGLFLEMQPNKQSVIATAQSLEGELRKALAAMSRILRGDLSTAGLDGSISSAFYVLVGAAATKFKDQPVLPGYAKIRDKRGRQVAQKKIMIAQQELLRLKSILDALFRSFERKTAKVQRSDVSKILDDLKDAIAKTGAGQKELAADVKLKDLISDLPLRTTALDTTAGDIAVMSTESFKQWLNKLEAAIFTVQDLLEKGDWLHLSRTATNDKFTFLHISQLP